MEKAEWKKRIIKCCQDAGTYEDFYLDVIDTLAQIMENRDKTHEQYVESGSLPTIIHINKAKEKNTVKNPVLVMEMELNTQALSYWRDLGLTPSGLKKLNADAIKDKGVGSFEKLLERIT